MTIIEDVDGYLFLTEMVSFPVLKTEFVQLILMIKFFF